MSFVLAADLTAATAVGVPAAAFLDCFDLIVPSYHGTTTE